MCGTFEEPPTGLIPWFSKTEGNTYATIAASPFPLQGKPTQAQDVARRISGAVAGRSSLKSRHTKYPSQTHIPRIYIICHLPLIFLSPTLPLPFYLPSLSQSSPLLFARVLDCLFVVMAQDTTNCVTSPIPTIMILLALRLLLLPMLNLVKLILLC